MAIELQHCHPHLLQPVALIPASRPEPLQPFMTMDPSSRLQRGLQDLGKKHRLRA